MLDIRQDFLNQLRDLQKEARKAYLEDGAAADSFEQLQTTTAWGYYTRAIDRRLQMFADQMLSPAAGMDGLIASEFIKGAMFGLSLARDLPSVTIQAMKDLRPQKAEEE